MADTLDDLTVQGNSRMNMELPGDESAIVGQLPSILRADMDFLLITLKGDSRFIQSYVNDFRMSQSKRPILFLPNQLCTSNAFGSHFAGQILQ